MLARERTGSSIDYLVDRLSGIVCLVPGASEIHVRLEFFEQMLADGFVDVVPFLHRQGVLVDVWTLNAEGGSWADRMRRVVGAGADIVSTDTPRALSAVGSPAPEPSPQGVRD
jgi:hypothetical protein